MKSYENDLLNTYSGKSKSYKKSSQDGRKSDEIRENNILFAKMSAEDEDKDVFDIMSRFI